MNYTMYLLEFPAGVHFGKNGLDDTDICFCADTLFSALYQEALKLECQDAFVQYVQEDNLLFSDSFPYRSGQLFLPKPLAWIEHQDNGNSGAKKKYKKLSYIPADKLNQYFQGNLGDADMKLLESLGHYMMKVSVNIRGNQEPLPYCIRSYVFSENAGLYILAGYDKQEAKELFDKLMQSLSYSGIGGKRSSGLGHFESLEREVPEYLLKKLGKKGKRNMLLSTALPKDSELPDVLEDASYELIRRGGFVASETYAKQQMRKKDLYVFRSGSCFGRTFKGDVRDVSDFGSHSVYRYAKGMFMEVDL